MAKLTKTTAKAKPKKVLAVKKYRHAPPPYKHDVHACLNKITALAKKNSPDKRLEFELCNIERFGARPVRYRSGQPVRLVTKTKTGRERVRKTYIAHNFCPFCGKKF